MRRETTFGAALLVATTAAGALADGDVEVVLRTAHVVDGRTVAEVGVPVLNASGTIAVEVRNATPAGAQFVLIGAAGTTVIARSGDQAPGTNAALFDAFPASSGTGDGHLVLTDAGNVLFDAELAGGDATSSNDEGIWVGNAQQIQLLARDNGPLPGIATNYELELCDFAFSDAGTVGVSVRPTSGNSRFLLVGLPGALVSKGTAPNIRAPFMNAPVVLAIAASDPRWTGKKGNFTLKTAKGAVPSIVLNVNAAKGTFKATISKFDLAAAPASGFLAALNAGGSQGTETAVFEDRGGGKFQFRE